MNILEEAETLPVQGFAGFYKYKENKLDTQGVIGRMAQRLSSDPRNLQVLARDPFFCIVSSAVGPASQAGSYAGIHVNETRDIFAVSTGMAYNAQALAETLRHQGHKLGMSGSMEPVVHLYENLGNQCLCQLDGTFSFVLWDEKQKRLLLANDHMGQKPLFFTDLGGVFFFATLLEPLLEVSAYKGEINPAAVYYYFTYFYIPAPLTLLPEIAKLPPGNFILVDFQDGASRVVRYWVPDFTKREGSLEEMVTDFEETLDGVVQDIVGCHREIGLFFSGGVDSSCLASSLQRLELKARGYCFGSGTARDCGDEITRARAVSRYVGLELDEIRFNVGSITKLPDIIRSYGEPCFQFETIFVENLISEIGGETIPFLIGNGADGLFFGGPMFTRALKDKKRVDWVHQVPQGMLKLFSRLHKRIKHYLWLNELSLSQRVSIPVGQRVQRLALGLFSGSFLEHLSDLNPGAVLEQAFVESGADDVIDGFLYQYVTVLGHFCIVQMVTNLAAKHGMEAHLPFLHRRMIDFAASVPARYKVPSLRKRYYDKYLLRKSLQKVLPEELIFTEKMGLGMDVDYFLLISSRLRKMLHHFLFKRCLAETGIFNMDYVAQVYANLSQGKNVGGNAGLLWGLLSLELWYEMYTLGRKPQKLAKELMELIE